MYICLLVNIRRYVLLLAVTIVRWATCLLTVESRISAVSAPYSLRSGLYSETDSNWR